MKRFFYLFLLIMIVAVSCTLDSTNPDTPGLNEYGVLRIESWDTTREWYINIDDEYIGRELVAYNSGGVVLDFYEKSVIVGNHVISGYSIFQNDPAENMSSQTIYVPSQGLTFRPSTRY